MPGKTEKTVIQDRLFRENRKINRYIYTANTAAYNAHIQGY